MSHRQRGRAEDQFSAVVRLARRRVHLGRFLRDATHDAEYNRALCHDRLGAPETGKPA